MSVQDEITRIQNGKEDLINAISEYGVEIASDTPIEQTGDKVRAIGDRFYTKTESDDLFATKTEAKEIVTVDIINELIIPQNNAYFLELSRRMVLGEIVVMGTLGSDNAIVTAVSYDEANSYAAWSVGSYSWTLDGNGGLSSSNSVVFAIYNLDGVIQYGLQEYPLSDYITRDDADWKYAEKSNVFTKEESDNKYAGKTEVYTKTESDNKYATIKTLYDSYATKNEVKTEVANLVNSAPETLDTLGEVAKAIKDNESTVTALNSAIGNKANKSEVYTRTQSDNKYADKEEFKQVVTELTEDFFTITDSYITRPTAQGKKIANGDFSILEKVEGNTIVYGKDENGLNGKIANAIFGGIRIYGVNLTDGVVQPSPTNQFYRRLYLNLPKGVYTITFDRLVFVNSVGSSFTRKSWTENSYGYFHIEVINEDTSNQWINVRLEPNDTAWEDTIKIAVFKGNFVAPNIPDYVEGGVDEIIFNEKIELPLWKTLDFTNRKIINYGVKVELTGTESCFYYSPKSAPYHGIGIKALKTNETGAFGVSTDFEVGRNVSKPNTVILGQENNNYAYFIDVLSALRIINKWADIDNPTDEEKSQAVRDFKAYLAERYANGNPVTIYYLASTLQSEEDFPSDLLEIKNECKAWEGGTETILGDFKTDEAGNSNQLTLTQKYNTAIFSRLDNLEKQVKYLLTILETYKQ